MMTEAACEAVWRHGPSTGRRCVKRRGRAACLAPALAGAWLVIIVHASPSGCQSGASDESASTPATQQSAEETMPDIRLTSSEFEHGSPIPKKYTCDGEDLSPPLAIAGVPDGAASLALICDDPDAPMGTWVHWVLYNVAASADSLPAEMPTDAKLSEGVRQGVTDFKRPGYGGPCPPRGKPHRYFFKIYALDELLDLEGEVTAKKLEKAMQGHILAQGQLMGTYQRQ